MLYVFTENRKNNRSYNTSTRNRQEQNLATFWVLNRGRRGMLEFEFRFYFKTFHVRILLLKKERKRKWNKNEQKVLVSCCFTLFGILEQTCSFVNLVNLFYRDKYSQLWQLVRFTKLAKQRWLIFFVFHYTKQDEEEDYRDNQKFAELMKDKNEARREFVEKKSMKEQREYLPIFAIREEVRRNLC